MSLQADAFFDLSDDDDDGRVLSPPPYERAAAKGLPPIPEVAAIQRYLAAATRRPPSAPTLPTAPRPPPVARSAPTLPTAPPTASRKPLVPLQKGFRWGVPVGPPCDAYNPAVRYRPAPPGQHIAPMNIDP